MFHDEPSHTAAKAPPPAWTTQPVLQLVPAEPPAAPSVADFFASWLTTLTHIRPSSRVVYASWTRNHIVPLLGELPIDTVSDPEVRAFAVALRARLGPTTASNIMTMLRAALDQACVEGYLTRNAARSLPRSMRVGRSVRPRRILSRTEIKAVFDVIPDGGWERPLFLTCMLAGLRSGEVRGLKWCDIDFLGERIRVRQQAVNMKFAPLKTPMSERDVVLHEELSHELTAHQARAVENDLDLVFARHGQIMRPAVMRYRLNRAIAQAHIAHTTIHDLRRTFGSILIAAGADVTYVQRQMGHSSPHVTLLHYAGLWDEQKNTDKVAAYLNLVDTSG